MAQNIGTQGAQTIVPGTSDKYIGAGRYLTGMQTIKGDAALVPANIVRGKSIFGVNGSAKCGALKFTLGQSVELNNIKAKTNIAESYTFQGGPDGAQWYNWKVSDGKIGNVTFSVSGGPTLGNPGVTPVLGVIIRVITYGTDAPASGRNGYTYGPVEYSDYWIPGNCCGYSMRNGWAGAHVKAAHWLYYSFGWVDTEKSSIRLSFSNRSCQPSSGDTWTQWRFTLYPVTGIDTNSFDAYEGTGFSSRDILGL
ncbi:MAG: hypothetical protein HFH68_16665 [Lachnospiraceae bacterium]|nr:hypothetical protein [Lachnospiraceae bacterium]